MKTSFIYEDDHSPVLELWRDQMTKDGQDSNKSEHYEDWNFISVKISTFEKQICISLLSFQIRLTVYGGLLEEGQVKKCKDGGKNDLWHFRYTIYYNYEVFAKKYPMQVAKYTVTEPRYCIGHCFVTSAYKRNTSEQLNNELLININSKIRLINTRLTYPYLL